MRDDTVPAAAGRTDPDAGAAKLRELVSALETRLGLLNEAELSCCGVTLAQCHALVEAGRAGAHSLNELAAAVGVDAAAMSRTVQALVEKGDLRRAPDGADRRRVVIELTDAGRDKFRGIEGTMDAEFSRAWWAIPEGKRSQVLESVELLLRALPGADGPCCGGDR